MMMWNVFKEMNSNDGLVVVDSALPSALILIPC